jgi:hypothetical protein
MLAHEHYTAAIDYYAHAVAALERIGGHAPVCLPYVYNRNMYSQPIMPTILPHSSFGDLECCGCLCGIVAGDRAAIVCNECNVVVRRVPTGALEKTFTEMELSVEVATEKCPYCGSVNILPGFSKVSAFTCRTCQKAVRL